MNHIITLAATLVLALGAGRIATLFKIPRVTGYLLAGVFMGPSFSGFLTGAHLEAYGIISELALGMIAFYIGCEFEAAHFKKLKETVLYFSSSEIGVTLAFVFLALLALLRHSPATALLLGILAVATAPAATLLVIREYDSEGPLTDHVLALVGLNNLFCILAFVTAFSFISLATPGAAGPAVASVAAEIARQLLIPPVVGSAIALFLRFCLRLQLEQNELLMISLSGIMLGAGLSHYFSVSPLLTNLVMGAVLINSCDRARMVLERLKQIDYPFLALFFVLAGANLHMDMLREIGIVSLLYIAARIIGKIAGVQLGSKWAGAGRPAGLYLGMGILAQAGLAIGLSSWAARKAPSLGEPLMAVILGTTVVFEIIGPILTRYSLIKGGEIRIVKLLTSVGMGDFKSDIYLLTDRVKQALGMTPSYQKASFRGPVLVKHLMRHHIDTIPQDAPLDRIVKIMERSRYSTLPVVTRDARWTGMVSLDAIKDLFFDRKLGHLIIAQDIAHRTASVSAEDTLEKAIQALEGGRYAYLPVVDKDEGHRFLGVLHYRDVCLFRLGKKNRPASP